MNSKERWSPRFAEKLRRGGLVLLIASTGACEVSPLANIETHTRGVDDNSTKGFEKINLDLSLLKNDNAVIKTYQTPIPTTSSLELACSPEGDRDIELRFGLAWPHQIEQLSRNLDQLQMNWFFTSWNPELLKRFPNSYAPITRCGLTNELKGLSQSYDGYLIVFNEPNLPEPNGCLLVPEEAAARYRSLRKTFPNAKMVVGNPSAWEVGSEDGWLFQFADLVADNPPYAFGIHAYVEEWITPEHISKWINSFVANNPSRIWVTETGICSGNTDKLTNLLELFGSIKEIERIAFYTDLQPEGVPWGICNGKINLMEENGNLSPAGAILNRTLKNNECR